MKKPLFDIVCIAKNEARTLPRMMSSLKEYLDRGGKVFLLDTGSTDGTPELARSLGCNVFEVGAKFITTIDDKLAKEINDRFIVEGEAPIVKGGDTLFDFASARNYIASLAEQNMICTLDCDEAYSVFNIDALNELIEKGFEQFEYSFCFAHNQWGQPQIEFIQSKFYDRRKMQWEGIVHEVLQGDAKRILIKKSIIYLEHWQEPGKDHRPKYLAGLALDCLQHQEKDRQSHYLAREILWTGRPKSAIKEFERHIAMNRWQAERAQSMIFMGDAYGQLLDPINQVIWYSRAYMTDPNRREALIKLAQFYQANNVPKAVAVYAKGALELPWSDYYANQKDHYEATPHALLYWAYGWMGDIPKAQEHILKALEYQRENPDFLRDTKFYFEYPANTIPGWMSFKEQTFLYDTAKKMDSVVELGSWKGKSTHALCSSKCPSVTAIDTWMGSKAEPDAHAQAKDGSVYKEFLENMKGFTNLTIIKDDINNQVDNFADKSVDMIFIDASHTYEDVLNDIRKWKPKAKKILCGHDYTSAWSGVQNAVDEIFGKPDDVFDTIWVVYLNK
jgi:tetratricopeptide (TPR) repeat protein